MKKLFSFLLCILICPILVSAIGIGPPRLVIDFEPEMTEELNFFVVNTEQAPITVNMYVKGELAEYLKVEKQTFDLNPGERKDVKATLSLPEKIETPGQNLIKVGALSSPKGAKDATVAAKAGVESQIYINVPYEGKYLTASLSAEDVKLGEDVEFILNARNNGLEDISSVSAVIEVFDSDEKQVRRLNSLSESVAAGETKNIKTSWNTEDINPGKYKAIADVNFDGEHKDTEASFNVGDVLIEIIDLETNKFKPGDIARFIVTIESKWNEKIYDAYAGIEIYDINGNLKGQAESKEINIEPWSQKELEIFWDSTSIIPGNYDVKVKLYYEGKSSEKSFDIDITKTGSSWSIIIIIAIVAVAGYVAWLVWGRKRSKKKKR